MSERFLIKKEVSVEGQVLSELQKKKAARNAHLQEEKNAALKALSKENKKLRWKAKANVAKYEKEYRMKERHMTQLRREAKKNNNYFVEPEPKLVFAIRLVGINKLAPKPRKILQLLRLRQINNGVFLKMNQPMMLMLRCVQPYVTYGYPTLKQVRSLIYKRGFGKIDRQRIPLDDNRKIHDALGQYGISCMEDLIHEIYTAGPHFKQANNFLWPFKLRAPRGGFVNKRHGFNEPRGGDWGNREEMINDLLKRMI